MMATTAVVTATASKTLLVGVGNPLLDTSITCGVELLAKYGLTRGEAILAGPSHLPLYGEVMGTEGVVCIAGGSALNSIRAYQWMLNDPFHSAFIGSVGPDSNGQKLKDIVEEGGVKSLFMECPTAPTGVCAVLVTDRERNLITNLGAAEKFDHRHFLTEEVQKHVHEALAFYAEGYFLTVSHNTLVQLGRHACDTNKVFAFNLSAEFLVNVDPFFENMKQVLPYVDFLFCNDSEALSLAKRCSFSTNLEETALQIASMQKANTKRQRTVIITQGAKPTIVCHMGKVIKLAVPLCRKEEIVDTNGAGDSFVGGFLFELVSQLQANRSNLDIQLCVRSAQYCAMQCIKVAGCDFKKITPIRASPMAKVMKAAAFAAEKHKSQRRKGGDKEPYISHPVGVTDILTQAGVEDPVVLQAALLHDTLEDTATTVAELEGLFGGKVASVVQEVTDDKSLSKTERKKRQIEHAAHISREAKLVKLADKIHNLESLSQCPVWDAKRTQGYMVWAYFVCQHLLGHNNLLDARARSVFDACPVIAEAAAASPNDSGLSLLQQHLSDYFAITDAAKD